jgi:transcriptional regulator with XRE-family HTH domain
MVRTENQWEHMHEVYFSIGNAIRTRRDSLGMTQATLAEKTGLSRTSVTNIERGGQGLLVHQLLEIAKALRVAPASLLPVARADVAAQQSVSGTIKALLDLLDDSKSARRRR